MTRALLDHRVLLVTGKGGVGKSTVAAALARHATSRGKRVLLVEYESLSRAAPLFGVETPDATPTEVADNLWLMQLDPLEALHVFVREQLRVEALARLALRNETVRHFFLAMPAIRSVLFLYLLWLRDVEEDKQGEPRWDLLVCDMPTSGFVRGLYGVPSMLSSIFRVGPAARYAEALQGLLFDPGRTGVVLVSLAEEMPVVETVELAEQLRARYDVEPAAAIANGVYPSPPATLNAAEAQARGRPVAERTPADALLWATATMRQRHERAASLLPTLGRAAAEPVIELPHAFVRGLDLAAIDELAEHLGDGLVSAASPKGARHG